MCTVFVPTDHSKNMSKRKKIGLALGGGAARGCAHIGVIRALEEAGYEIEAISGTSIGALIGGVYASGGLGSLEAELETMSIPKVLSFWDLRLPVSGLVKGQKVEDFLQRFLPISTIGRLPIPFAAVGADLKSGDRVVLDKGALLTAIRASISLPAIFPPVKVGKRYLVDGGLVDPVPVKALRDMGVKTIVAVDLNYHLEDASESLHPLVKKMADWVRDGNPLLFDVLYRSVMMIQRELTIANFQLDPPHLVIRPRVGTYKAFDFHRSQELIEEGYRSMKQALKRVDWTNR